MSHELLRLAELCEKAEGPDRRLDVLIGCAVRQMPMKDPGAFLQEWPHPFVPCQFSGAIAAPGDNGGVVCHWEAREFTASIDAALSLVPEGWLTRHVGQATKGSGWQVYLDNLRAETDDDETCVSGTAKTESLSRCAAALRAREPGAEGTRPDSSREHRSNNNGE